MKVISCESLKKKKKKGKSPIRSKAIYYILGFFVLFEVTCADKSFIIWPRACDKKVNGPFWFHLFKEVPVPLATASPLLLGSD